MQHSDSQDYHLIRAAAAELLKRVDSAGIASERCPGEMPISDFELRKVEGQISHENWRIFAPTLAASLEVDGYFVRTDYHPEGRTWVVWVHLLTRRIGRDGRTWRDLGALQAEQDTSYCWKNQVGMHWQSLPLCAAGMRTVDPTHLRKLFRNRVEMTAAHVVEVKGDTKSEELHERYYKELISGYFSRLEEMAALQN